MALCMLMAVSEAQQQTTGTANVAPVRVKAIANFDFDRSGVRSQDQPKLLADVAKMTDVTWQVVLVTGHTDSIGPARYNDRLSQRRAVAVKSYLVDEGLDANLISTAGKGPTEPVAPNDTVDGRRQNRRAEIEFQGVRATK
ncbi:MAG: OmpA family protein [Burkholderiales bacterium]